ncbi:MAG: PQQ-binding-like beta-propeller repeat protein, partial [Lentisphaeria bacterium]|nr:PQQ-binding-like beta-propeller repeat protein [Lentisphaeria bacterium]
MNVRHALVSLVLAGFFLPVAAEDWPTYRHDAGRSGCSARALPPRLALRWRQRLPVFQMAFPNEKRQQFDLSHEPVCAAGILVVGCPADGSVRAYAAATGEERWRFHAEAPVRLAPVLHDGKVLFGADDGRFRCLDLATGRLLWERPAYPAERPDVRLLGNNRLISCWPVRGGPVAVDGTVYYGSGIWPTMGVYVQAVDIVTGEPRWTNAGLGHIEGVRIDHNLRYDAGISPQGYLLAAADRLVVTNGRSHPLGLNRADGSLFHFVQGYRNGHCRVTLGGNYIFVGSSGVLALADFREVGNKWEAAGTDAPEVFSSEKFDQFEGPYHPYKRFAGCDADSLFDGETAYSLVNGVLYAHHLGESGVSEYPLDQGGKSYAPFRWDARMVLRAATGLGGDTQLFAKAGQTLYGRAGKRIVALELTGENPPARLAWECAVPARPTSLIVADECLFAALEDGSLLGFAEGEEQPADRTEPTVQVAPAAPPDLPAAEGIAVVLGSLSPGETEHLLATTSLRLLVVNLDRKETEAERRRLAAAGVYDSRIERCLGEPLEFRLPPYLADLLWLRDQLPSETQLRQAWTAVHPYGGRLRFTGTPQQIAAFAELARQANLEGAELAADGEGVTLSRPGGPVGAADWTHETADAARSFFSRDLAVRAPLAPLWFGDGPGYGFIKHKDYGRGVKPQVVQGRVFALQQHTATLFAYDAYTGRVLWQTRGEDDDAGFITRFASLPDGIYAAGKGRCVV